MRPLVRVFAVLLNAFDSSLKESSVAIAPEKDLDRARLTLETSCSQPDIVQHNRTLILLLELFFQPLEHFLLLDPLADAKLTKDGCHVPVQVLAGHHSVVCFLSAELGESFLDTLGLFRELASPLPPLAHLVVKGGLVFCEAVSVDCDDFLEVSSVQVLIVLSLQFETVVCLFKRFANDDQFFEVDSARMPARVINKAVNKTANGLSSHNTVIAVVKSAQSSQIE